ncbi:hypothetical protein [Candidatus Tisiphia endosymbiont of Beris chalybata]|uniref:hypothetical protein n=1 Tax=Candidatus Tisiphia endosymbiont of Beris chalybata TaxID=3066262 RepID=UPI00312C844E
MSWLANTKVGKGIGKGLKAVGKFATSKPGALLVAVVMGGLTLGGVLGAAPVAVAAITGAGIVAAAAAVVLETIKIVKTVKLTQEVRLLLEHHEIEQKIDGILKDHPEQEKLVQKVDRTPVDNKDRSASQHKATHAAATLASVVGEGADVFVSGMHAAHGNLVPITIAVVSAVKALLSSTHEIHSLGGEFNQIEKLIELRDILKGGIHYKDLAELEQITNHHSDEAKALTALNNQPPDEVNKKTTLEERFDLQMEKIKAERAEIQLKQQESYKNAKPDAKALRVERAAIIETVLPFGGTTSGQKKVGNSTIQQVISPLLRQSSVGDKALIKQAKEIMKPVNKDLKVAPSSYNSVTSYNHPADKAAERIR